MQAIKWMGFWTASNGILEPILWLEQSGVISV
jgi:hypothetical protein